MQQRRFLPELLIVLVLFLLPLGFFWQQTLGGKTLLPSENLYQYEPFATYREVVQAPEIPHNHLLSDMVLQNHQWKSFIQEQLAIGEVPLWNPHQFSGIPFFAAGQQSTLYPLSILYYILPLPVAYGWFIVINLWLAGVFMFAFLRGLGVGRAGSLLAGVIYQLAGFMLASVVFPMMIAAAVWLPLLLLMVENIIRERPLWRFQATPIPWVAIGAVALGSNIFAGHIEITIYTLLILAYYAGLRLLWLLIQSWRREKPNSDGQTQESAPTGLLPNLIRKSLWLTIMVALGIGLASLQFIPLFEFAQTNWRAERSSLDTVLSYAHPFRDVLQFLMPNFYGSPAHHSYVDIFTMETITDLKNAAGETIHFIDWGIKNYVESALYLGILPLLLAGYALLDEWRSRRNQHQAATNNGSDVPYRGIFALLSLISLTFMFGLPTYAAVYILPGINQLNSPFRWIYALTLCIAVLAGFGLDALSSQAARGKLVRRIGILLTGFGILILGGLLASRVLYPQLEPLIERIFTGMVKAPEAFADARMFYSYQFPNILIFGGMVLLSGIIFWWSTRAKTKAFLWQVAAIVIIMADLMLAMAGFNPASDPLLLDFTPPAIQWLQAQEGDWRYTTLDDPALRPIMNANIGWRYGLDDIRGYESIISKQYVDFMREVAPQGQLDFNRIAPLYTYDLETVDWSRLDLLNVRYIFTHKSTDFSDELTTTSDPRRFSPRLELGYEDEAVRIWDNHGAFPRVHLVEPLDDLPPALNSEFVSGILGTTITHDTGREKFIDVDLQGVQTQWLVISETYAPGWRAFIRPMGSSEDFEQPFQVDLILENLQGVRLSPNELHDLFSSLDLDDTAQIAIGEGQYTVRMVYSPASFQVGLFGSVISVGLIVFLMGVWFWRGYVGVNTEDSSTAARVARNSIAPIILNLFNRGIDFAFAIVMLRILSPEDVGIYYFAIIVFVWFDIFTNFGLDLFLIREAAREKARSGYYFYNTTFLRSLLSLIGIPILVGFLAIWQGSVDEPLTTDGLIAIGLLYLGLFPASLNKGMTSLFYAYEQAEKPAAIATITTINKAIFGVIALLLGYGIVGLAAVSIINNFITFFVLIYVGRSFIGAIREKIPSLRLIREMVRESYPLMLNHFLAHIFFQIDIVILQALRGAVIVGQYSVAYRWLLAINIIPSFFTQALLPVMSRQAKEDREALKRYYGFGIKLLVTLALPLAVGFTFLAETLTFILGGVQYLPNGAIALQLMIWSIPLGWMNSLTQYVLVAMDLQRQVTQAFFAAVLFNIIVNLIFIPQFGFQAAAIATIASEFVLLIPFAILTSQGLGGINWRELVWRQLVATGAMILMTLAVWSVQPLFALIAGSILYVAVLLMLRPLNEHELSLLMKMLPGRLQEARMVRVLLGLDAVGQR